MRLLLDPPVTVWHDVTSIAAWIRELTELADKHRDDLEALRSVHGAASDAHRMLDVACQRHLGADWPKPTTSHEAT